MKVIPWHSACLFRFPLIVCALAGSAILQQAQNGGSTGLAIRVMPESHIDPSSLELSFHVHSPGVTAESTPVKLYAWVRSLPNQQIRLTARPQLLTGPAGSAPLSAVRWIGDMERATGGAIAAACNSGAFSGQAPQLLISGWRQSGIAVCNVRFALAAESDWPAGIYNCRIDLSLSVTE
jgi:hypothetical protein